MTKTANKNKTIEFGIFGDGLKSFTNQKLEKSAQ